VIQPLHFSHGYMFVPMAILTVRCLARIAKDWKLQVKRFAAAAFLIFVSIDNVMFVAALGTFPGRVVLERDICQTIHFLAEREPPAVILTLPPRPFHWIDLMVCSPHRLFILSPEFTPFCSKKLEKVFLVLKEPNSAKGLANLGISWVVLHKQYLEKFQRDIYLGKARFAAQYGRYSIIEILIPPTRNLIPRHTDDQY